MHAESDLVGYSPRARVVESEKTGNGGTEPGFG